MASESESASELPNNGPFYFAWVGAGETTFGPEHHRMDETVLSFTVNHEEGNFASLNLTIKNPRQGLLAPMRKQWAWLAWDDGLEIVPLFFGRVTAIPQNIGGETLSIQLLAKPRNFEADKLALAETLKVAPYFDPVFVDPDSLNDPDAALDARTALYHIDRITHAVTISDILNGEDGAVEFGEDKIIYESLGVSYGESPANACTINASVSWAQQARGTLDITKNILQKFKAAADSIFISAGRLSNNLIATYTGGGLINSWPKDGAAINDGWIVDATRLTANDPGVPVDLLNGPGTALPNPDQPVTGPPGSLLVPLRYNDGTPVAIGSVQSAPVVAIPMWWIRIGFRVGYAVTRDRSETIEMTLRSDVQAVMADQSDGDTTITISRTGARADSVLPNVPGFVAGESESASASGEVSSFEGGDSAPIFDSRRRSYFNTDRGKQSVYYLVLLARAALIAKARTVQTTFDVPFTDAIALSCRKTGVVFDSRLPGGKAIGKIVSYEFGVDGTSGQAKGTVTIASAIGNGGAPTVVDGEPDYMEEGYVEKGYQTETGATVLMPDSDVTVGDDLDSVAPNDDGVDFINGITPDKMIDTLEVIDGAAAQANVMMGVTEHSESESSPKSRVFFGTPSDLVAALNAVFTQVKLRMVPVTGGPFTTDYPVTLSELSIPKQINLEAVDDVVDESESGGEVDLMAVARYHNLEAVVNPFKKNPWGVLFPRDIPAAVLPPIGALNSSASEQSEFMGLEWGAPNDSQFQAVGISGAKVQADQDLRESTRSGKVVTVKNVDDDTQRVSVQVIDKNSYNNDAPPPPQNISNTGSPNQNVKIIDRHYQFPYEDFDNIQVTGQF